MFLYSPALLMQSDDLTQIIHYAITALVGVYLLAGALQKWYFGVIEGPPRLALLQIARRKKAALPTQ